jgi:hypothetical protein
MVGVYKFEATTESVIYLKLSEPLAAGKEYTVSFPGSRLPDQKFTLDPARLRSEAVHVSQIGFRSDDPAKVAFLSCWLGSGGGVKYGDKLPFEVIDESTGKPVFQGRAALSKAASDKTEDAYNKNYSGVDVDEMDFTALRKPGSYRISVQGIGCLYPFEIGEEAWRRAFTVSAKGLYHQRSGIALGPPFTTYQRPRAFHPDDGVKVYASTAPLMDTGNGLNQKDSNFGNLVKRKNRRDCFERLGWVHGCRSLGPADPAHEGDAPSVGVGGSVPRLLRGPPAQPSRIGQRASRRGERVPVQPRLLSANAITRGRDPRRHRIFGAPAPGRSQPPGITGGDGLHNRVL